MLCVTLVACAPNADRAAGHDTVAVVPPPAAPKAPAAAAASEVKLGYGTYRAVAMFDRALPHVEPVGPEGDSSCVTLTYAATLELNGDRWTQHDEVSRACDPKPPNPPHETTTYRGTIRLKGDTLVLRERSDHYPAQLALQRGDSLIDSDSIYKWVRAP